MSEMETAVYFWGSRMQKTGWGERGGGESLLNVSMWNEPDERLPKALAGNPCSFMRTVDLGLHLTHLRGRGSQDHVVQWHPL